MKRRRWLKISGGVLVLLLLFIGAAWHFPQQILTIDSGSCKADVIVVLGGGSVERPDRAAELFKADEAPLIICSGDGDAAPNQVRLTKSDVPAKNILLEPKSHSTRENAEFSIALLRARHIKSAIIVTSWFHSRRTLRCFEHYAPEIKFYSRPSYAGYARADWKNTGTAGYVKSEYVKLLGYWVCYGVCPL